MKHVEAKQLWLEAVERVKDRTLAPTLWRALEMGHGVTKENDLFIVGFAAADGPMAGYLTSADHKVTIEKVLTELIGSPTRLKIIEGNTLEDYEAHKKREAVAEETRQRAQVKRHVERAAERAWETISEQVSRKYAKTHLRQLPHIRARYIFEAVQIVSEAIDKIHPDGKIDEIGHRALGRVVDRIGTLADVPGPLVGIELMRYRNELETKS